MNFPLALRGHIAVWLLISILAPVSAQGQVDHSRRLDQFLSRGQLQQAAEHFASVTSDSPGDSQARLALGLTQFLQAVEGLGQSNYRHGLIGKYARQIPLARLPVPLNPNPEPISYEELRKIVADFHAGLQRAEATLAQVDTAAVRLNLHIGRVRLDLDGDGALAEEETLWRAFSAINTGVDQQQGTEFYVGVDGADVHWLRGYCHVTMAVCDVFLAHDERELFERCGHLLFVRIESPYLLTQQDEARIENFDVPAILDLVAAIHLIRFPVIDKERMASAHEHLLQMIHQSRECWRLALAETDNDREWIPNPDQDSVIQVRVPGEMITGWTAVLDELEAILQGKKLIPYWRKYFSSPFSAPEIPDRGWGINLKKVFVDPRGFDLLLMIQGSDAEPYLEEGALTTPEAWDELTRVFRGQFFGFAIWFN